MVIGEEKCRRFCFERSSVDYLKIDGQFAVLRYTKHGPHCSGPLQSTPIFFSLCRTTPRLTQLHTLTLLVLHCEFYVDLSRIQGLRITINIFMS